jgi:hypothetical protein
MDRETQSLAGPLLVLQVLASALLRSHPSPGLVLAEVSALAQATRDAVLPTTLPDGVLAAFESELKLLTRELERCVDADRKLTSQEG